MDGQKDGQMDGRTNGWTDGWTDGWMDGRTDGWMDGWTDGRMDGWMDGWIERQIDGLQDKLYCLMAPYCAKCKQRIQGLGRQGYSSEALRWLFIRDVFTVAVKQRSLKVINTN